MTSWTSPRDSRYRDNSPASPLSPSTLSQWLRSGKPRASVEAGVRASARLKTVGIIMSAFLLGWWAMSALGPGEESTFELDPEAYDIASGGVLNNPSGYGQKDEDASTRPGIIGNVDDEDDLELVLGQGEHSTKKPSVSGALSELHEAVTDKLQSWNPYHQSSAHPKLGGLDPNQTSTGKGRKKPVNPTDVPPVGEAITEGTSEDERLGARVRIGKCTILFNGNNYWERSIRTHEAHDRLHGYRLHVLRQKVLDDVWDKPAYILSLLLRELAKPEGERLDWLMWVDADTIILNPHIPIETFLPPAGTEFDDVHLMYSNDWNGLNNGVFPVRVNQWAVDLFSAIVSYRYYRPDDRLVFRDQSAMNTLMNEPKFVNNIVQAPQRWFNAYQGEHNETLNPFQVRRGDLLVHFAGVSPREERMGYWLERAEQHLDDWEIPVKSTTYPQEARDFWNEQRDLRKNQKLEQADVRKKATDLLTKTNEQVIAYGDHLTDVQKEAISKAQEELKKITDDPAWEHKVPKMKELTTALEQACLPLLGAVTESNKLLLNAAHEAIFAGEKDLLEGGFHNGVANPEMQMISDSIKSLKTLVMSSEDHWNREDITAATNGLTEARGRLQAKTNAIQAEAKAIEEARKQVQLEADQAAAESGMTDLAGPAMSTFTSPAAALEPVGPVEAVATLSPPWD